MRDDAVLLPHGVKLCPSPDKQVFGYGDHPSTKRCLEVIESRIKPGMRVADVGSGTGILSIKAALLGAQVTAYEIDESLHDLIRENAEVNGVEFEIRSKFPEDWDGQKYDFLVANLGQEGDEIDFSQYAVKTFNEHKSKPKEQPIRVIEIPQNAIVERLEDGTLVIKNG